MAISYKTKDAPNLWFMNSITKSFPREMKIHVYKKTCIKLFMTALFIIDKNGHGWGIHQ